MLFKSISLFDKLIYRLKLGIKKNKIISKINRNLKAYQLRSGLKRLYDHYLRKGKKLNISYHEKDAIDSFRQKLATIRSHKYPKKNGELRIFWIGANRDQDESGFLQALRRLGTVIEFRNWKGSYGQWYWDEQGNVSTYDPSIVALNDQSLLSQIACALQDGPIDLLMGQMWANYISKEALAEIRSYDVPIINISMDDRLPNNWMKKKGKRLGAVGLSEFTDLVLTTSSETCHWYRIENCAAIFWPLASDPDIFNPDPNTIRDIDVLFIGNKYGIREYIVQELNKQGVQVECYGAGWPNGPSTAEQSAHLFKRAKIILGVGTVGYCNDVFTLKLRDFDAPMSGAFYITHRNNDLSQLYQEGIEIECYRTTEELVQKMKYYLSHPENRNKIAQAGRMKAVKRDTWYFRLKNTFETLGLLEP